MRLLRYAWVLLALGLLVWGAINLQIGLAERELLPMRVADLEAGTPPPSHWLNLSGKLLSEERVIWDGVRPIETYVAMVSEDWRPGQPVEVFVRTDDGVLGRPGKLLKHEGSVVGIVRSRTLPDWVGDAFHYNDLKPVDRPWVVTFEAKPGDELFFAGVALAGVMVIAAAAAWTRARRRAGAACAAASGRETSEEKQP